MNWGLWLLLQYSATFDNPQYNTQPKLFNKFEIANYNFQKNK